MLDNREVGIRIKALRGNLSQRVFAEQLKFKQTYVSEIETGKTKPSLEFLVALSDKFQTTIDFVVRGGKIANIHNREKLASSRFLKSLSKINNEVIKATERIKKEAS